MLLIILAIVFGLGGAIAFYLAWPDERRGKDVTPKPLGLALSGIGIAASVITFTQVVSTLSAFFNVLLIVMLVWTGLPFLNQLLKGRKANG